MPRTLLCLHGWGGSSESFTELRAALKGEDVEIIAPDLPGFGTEPEPLKPWTNDDYAVWAEHLITEKIGDKPFEILGHSHGGRIITKLMTRGNIAPKHVYLCAPAGIRHPRHFKRALGLTLAKTGKFFLSIPGLKALQPLGKKLLYKLVRVHDYEKASPVMRQTLINVTKEDLRPYFGNIKPPTDIFWGKADGMTPYSDALEIEQLIPQAELHTYPGVHHRVHRDRATEIAKVIMSHA